VFYFKVLSEHARGRTHEKHEIPVRTLGVPDEIGVMEHLSIIQRHCECEPICSVTEMTRVITGVPRGHMSLRGQTILEDNIKMDPNEIHYTDRR
jgi:hypothetical protein